MELLLKEAQQEIALLRTDLFNTRRLAEERRQAVDALQSERERLAKHCEVVEGQLRSANAQLNHVPELQQRCAHLESQLRKLQSEIETAHAARRILEQELDDERRQRGAMTEQKALLEGDRARLAKQRDDLAAQLRVEQKKAREAEEEQVRAEEDAAALRSEIAALQQASAAATASSSSLAAAQSTANAAAAGPASAADTAAAIAASVAAATGPLLEQVEHERNRAAMLLSNLHAAKSEIMELSNKIADYEARHVQSVSHGPQDNEHLVQQLALAHRRGDELGERLAEATERSRQLEAEAQALREAAQAAAEAAVKAVDEAAAAKAAAVAQQQHGSSSHAGLPPLPPGGSSSSHQQQHSESSRAGGVAQHQAMAALRQSAAAEGMHHRVASSGSLYGSGQNELLMQEGAELSAEDTARLRQQVRVALGCGVAQVGAGRGRVQGTWERAVCWVDVVWQVGMAAPWRMLRCTCSRRVHIQWHSLSRSPGDAAQSLPRQAAAGDRQAMGGD